MGLEVDDYGFSTLTVKLSDREDGGVSVSCVDLPGLILSGANKGGVVAAIPTAVSGLLRFRGVDVVSVKHALSMAEILQGQNPQNLDMHICHFVVEYKKAA